jgi:hypothetical protein
MMHASPPATDDEGDASSLRHVAHELRSPLTSVLGVFSLLEDGSLNIGDAEARELAHMGRREAEQMLFVVENLLTSARLAQGTLETDPMPVDLHAVFDDALSRFPDVARRTFLPIDRGAVVTGDEHLISQIATNLVQNLDRYAPDGEAEIRFDHTDDMVITHVADDGPGIPVDRHESVFSDRTSEVGLGMGLAISRSLARLLGGDLVVSPARLRSGATLTLTLPRSPVDRDAARLRPEREAQRALPPSARLLVDMTEVLSNQSLPRVVAGIHRMLADLLDANEGCLAVRDRGGRLRQVGEFGSAVGAEVPVTAVVRKVFDERAPAFVRRLADVEPEWAERLGSRSALFLPVPGSKDVSGILAVGWSHGVEPSPRALEIATAVAKLAGFGIERASLAADADFERRLRSSVMEALPIAISVFAGDPPRAVDWNERERLLLGIERDDERPPNLAISQEKFDVRFLDGTPLNLDNAPVVLAIRTGAAAGPFFLRVRRADGTETVTRTYCAPFFDATGNAAAVVTSEEIGEAEALAELALRDAG